MNTEIPSPQALKPKGDIYPDIRFETRTHVPTPIAAYWLARKNQTMRIWALTGHPINPRRVNGRLAWAVADIKKLLGV